MNRMLLSLVVIVVIAVGGSAVYYLNSSSDGGQEKIEVVQKEEEIKTEETPVVEISPEASPSTSPEASTVPEVKTFTVIGTSDMKFSVKEIKVKKGDKVQIVFKNESGFHDWVIDDFNTRTKQIPAGQSETVEFIADKTGTFEYYCSVGKHRQNGMKGNLIVE